MLTSLAIVGGLCAAGARLFPTQKRSTVRRLTSSPRLIDTLHDDPLLLTHYPAQSMAGQQTGALVSLFGSQPNLRRQQLQEMSSQGVNDERSAAEQKVNRQIAISSVALALTAGGALYAPLNLLGVPALLVTISPLLVSAYHSLVKEKKIGVGVLDSLGTIGPLLLGHFFIAALASCLSNFSRKLLLKTEDQSRASLINVFGEQPAFVWIQKDGLEIEIPFEQLQIGDQIIVSAGHSIPVDGTISQGIASIDERALTGESQPVEKVVGDPVFASTLLLAGQIHVHVEKAGTDTVAAQIGKILNHTADFKSSIQSQGERVVEQGAIPTILISALTLPILGPESALAALYAAFGYHMRFAAPISVLNFLRITSETGILIKDGRSLELLSGVDTIVFDKTGTLTAEVPTVGQIYLCGDVGEAQLLRYAAAAETKQTHPIAQAICHAAHQSGVPVPPITEAKVEVGYGLTVRIADEVDAPQKLVHVGSGRFMTMVGIAIPAAIQQIEETCHAEGFSLIYVAVDQQLAGVIELRPTIRPEAQAIINELHRRNFSLYIISGDHEKPTQKLAAELGIDHYFAEVLPQNKASLIEQLQQEGRTVCFIGDGINDSIALKTANVSISLRGASTVATDTASIILMDNSLKKLIPLLDIAQDLATNLKRSIAFTMLPGIVCIGGVYLFGFGLVNAVMLYNMGLAISVANALWPLLKHEGKKRKMLAPISSYAALAMQPFAENVHNESKQMPDFHKLMHRIEAIARPTAPRFINGIADHG